MLSHQKRLPKHKSALIYKLSKSSEIVSKIYNKLYFSSLLSKLKWSGLTETADW